MILTRFINNKKFILMIEMQILSKEAITNLPNFFILL